jgi:hypothetical protein
MAKNRLTVLNVKEINGDLASLHAEITKFYFSRYELESLQELGDLLSIYEDKYSSLYEALIFSKGASYSYMSDKILTAILARLANYRYAISYFLNNGYSGHGLGELLNYLGARILENNNISKPLTIELTANDINITIKEN